MTSSQHIEATDTTAKSLMISAAVTLLARYGAEGVGMRQVAQACEVSVSSLYHHFADKDALLKSAFDTTNTRLGELRASLPSCSTAADQLRQLVIFQFDHAEAVVAVLKYYLAYRDRYHRHGDGVLPPQASLHMMEILQFGVARGEFYVLDMQSDAQVMTHAVNGYLLEYYPELLPEQEKQVLAIKISDFLLRALKGGEVHANR